MERFNVYPNPLGAGYLLNVQAQMLEHLTSRLAILLLTLKEGKRLTTTVIDDGENRPQSGAHHFRFDGHHCDRAGSQAG
jgi:hypothetical protein